MKKTRHTKQENVMKLVINSALLLTVIGLFFLFINSQNAEATHCTGESCSICPYTGCVALTPTPTPTQVPPTATLTPTSGLAWQYIGFTYAPIDFQKTLVEAQECTRDTMLMPFFNYLNSNHAEGPKKWYIKACPGEPVKV